MVPCGVFDLVRADVLRDAARLASRDVALADLVEEARLAVVDVTHDRDDGGPRDEALVDDSLGRRDSLRASSPRAAAMLASSLTATSSTSQPNSDARIFAVSASSVVLMCTPVIPIDRSFIRSSVDLSDMRCAIVWSVTFSSIRMTFLCALISAWRRSPSASSAEWHRTYAADRPLPPRASSSDLVAARPHERHAAAARPRSPRRAGRIALGAPWPQTDRRQSRYAAR